MGERDLHGKAYLELGKRKASAGANATVVLDGRASHNRSQLVDGTRRNGGGFCDTRISATELAARLFSRTTCR